MRHSESMDHLNVASLTVDQPSLNLEPTRPVELTKAPSAIDQGIPAEVRSPAGHYDGARLPRTRPRVLHGACEQQGV